MKKLALISVIVLAACSSPPEPPQVDWKQEPQAMNASMIQWQPTFTVIRSGAVSGTWEKVITNFVPENRLYDDAVFYAVAHSDTIIVETNNNGVDYFTAKSWLRTHGAYGVIQFKNKTDCVTCRSTNVYLIRKGNSNG
ncbi:cag pathogenicity island Cag12 family protein [Salmonella enterica]|nr:conjugal transfer protein [Salmonella enterica]EBV6531380.1 conjugal transfer protein [Salmonella enterica subsp. enterica serovar Oranienburg]EED3793408.1 conjugal transfer protein [Salmonella enterica subsp. enterica serovar Oranienburg]EJA5114995.1 conjugal transfer protein [Salmonella enterica]EJA5740860.1 conjugal transfer protein [Salmonella enterica]